MEKITKILYKSSLLVTLILGSSCSFYNTLFKDFNTKQEEPEIRIIDNYGKPRNVQMRTPRGNIDALSKQGQLTAEQLQNTDKSRDSQIIVQNQNKYVANENENQPLTAAERELTRTLEMQTANTTPQAEQENQAQISAVEDIAAREEMEYDLGKEEIIAEKPSQKSNTINSKPAQSFKGIFVQAGSFEDLNHAQKKLSYLQTKVGKSSKSGIMEAEVNGKTYHRIVFGPYIDKKKAGIMVKTLGKKGYKSIIIKVK